MGACVKADAGHDSRGAVYRILIDVLSPDADQVGGIRRIDGDAGFHLDVRGEGSNCRGAASGKRVDRGYLSESPKSKAGKRAILEEF
jgi:hypothetical protein